MERERGLESAYFLKGKSLLLPVLPKFWYNQTLSRLWERSRLYSLGEYYILYWRFFFFYIYSSTSLKMEINICLVCNEVSLSLLFQDFSVDWETYRARCMACTVHCFSPCLSYLGFFWSAGLLMTSEGRRRDGPARPCHRWRTKFLQHLELPVCFEGLLSGHKHVPDIHCMKLHPNHVSLLEKGTGRESYYHERNRSSEVGKGTVFGINYSLIAPTGSQAC